nr:HNH endonuclease [uncultured Haemophilus sp.]
MADGEKMKGVFPVFDSAFDAQLPEELYQATDAKQSSECNKQLKDAVNKNPELKAKFTEEQLEQIENGDTPDGYTWHHNEEKGKMQLVDTETHDKTRHTGGRFVWGGGTGSRK